MAWLNLFGRKVKAKDVTDGSGKTPILTYQPFKLLYQGTWAKGATKTITNADKYKLFCIYFLNEACTMIGIREPADTTKRINFSMALDNGASYIYKASFDCSSDFKTWTLIGMSHHLLNTNGNAGTELYNRTIYIYGIF